MAENATNNLATPILSFCATTPERVKDLSIKEYQLIFIIGDNGENRIALDRKGKRQFFNQIVEIESEQERLNLSAPVNGTYYFVIEKAVLWRYFNGWNQITTPPDEIVFIGTEMPELGQAKTLYVNKEEREISVWDEEMDKYVAVSNYTECITPEDVISFWA